MTLLCGALLPQPRLRRQGVGGVRRRCAAPGAGLPRVPVRVVAAQRVSPPPPPETPRLPPAPLIALCVLASVAVSAATAAPASAAAPSERRHTRDSRIRAKLVAEGRLAPRGVEFNAGRLTVDAAALKNSATSAAAEGAAAAAARSLQSGVSRKLKAARAALARPPAHVRGRAPSPLLVDDQRAAVVLSRHAPGAPSQLQVVTVRPAPRAAPLSPAAGWALLAAAMAAVLFALRPSRRAAQAAGHWVRDRSLGGRLVQVAPGEEGSGGPGAATQRWKRTQPRPTAAGSSPLDDDDAGLAALAKAKRASRAGGAADEEEETSPPPAWWCEPAPALAGGARRAAGAETARTALARLNAARVGGREYDATDFVALRVGCADAGAPLDTSAQAVTAREALFRGAVDAALTAASGGAAPLAGVPPGTLLTGLAGDLGVPRRRASQLVAAATAARLRGGLLDCLAQLRRGEQLPAALELSAVGAILRALPMVPAAPELEMVAASLAARSTDDERQQLLALCVVANGEDAAVLGTVRDALGMASAPTQ